MHLCTQSPCHKYQASGAYTDYLLDWMNGEFTYLLPPQHVQLILPQPLTFTFTLNQA